jgi:hypothetical protein
MRWALLVVVVLAPVQVAAAEGTWHTCVARGTSHTGRYTFRIATSPCSVYWRELDRNLEIARCAPPVIVAVKPFTVSAGWELHFNLATGAFEDFTPTWSDRGRCVSAGDGSAPD